MPPRAGHLASYGLDPSGVSPLVPDRPGGSASQPRYVRMRFVREHEPVAREVGAQPKNQLGYWVPPGDGEVQPSSKLFQGYTRELSSSVLHCLLEPGDQQGKLNPLGGTNFPNTDMVKVAAYTGNPRNGDFQVYKEGAIGVSQHPELDCTDSLAVAANCSMGGCIVALWGKVARSSAASRVTWGRPSVGTGSVLALGKMDLKSRQV